MCCLHVVQLWDRVFSKRMIIIACENIILSFSKKIELKGDSKYFSHARSRVIVSRMRSRQREHSRQQKIGKMNIYSIFTQGALLPLILVMSENTGQFRFTEFVLLMLLRESLYISIQSSLKNMWKSCTDN